MNMMYNTAEGGRFLEFFEKYKTKENKYSSHKLLTKLILKSLPNNPKIIDFGCYKGDFLVSLGDELPGSVLFGVDIENFVAQKYKINFFKINLNDKNELNQLNNYKFDIIILGDILEHILDPEEILNEMHRFKNIDSNIYLSIPNSAHWYFRLKIFLGKFDYKDNGLFDKTHIKFFTLKTIKALILKCNFQIVELEYSSIPWENIRVRNVFATSLSKFERLFIKIRPELFAYQVICRLKG